MKKTSREKKPSTSGTKTQTTKISKKTSQRKDQKGSQTTSKRNPPIFSSGFDTMGAKVEVAGVNLDAIAAYNDLVYRSNKQFKVMSRHKTVKAKLFNRGDDTVFIEHSIPKFSTGQNMFSTEDLVEGASESILKVFKRAGISPSPSELKAIKRGDYSLTRLDYFVHVDCGSAAGRIALMKALRTLMPGIYTNVAMYGAETIYVNQHSTRWTIAIYDKALEIEAHPMPKSVRRRERILDLASRYVRIELRIRGKELERLGLDKPSQWTVEKLQQRMNEILEKLHPLEGRVPDIDRLEDLPAGLRNKLKLYLLGDFAVFHNTPSMLSKDRKSILEVTGIDINCPATPEQQRRAYETVAKIFKNRAGFKSRPELWRELQTPRNKK